MSREAEEVPQEQGWAQATAGDCLYPVGGPQVALWSPGAFGRIKIPHKFSSNSENISRSKFSEIQKQQKQETGTRHLVNRLVQQNA